MKKSFKKYEKAGLPGGPNELKRFTNGFIISERGQWDYPGQPTAVPTPSGRITMEGVEDNLLGIDNLGNSQYMTPGNEYQFEGDMVYEIPQAKKGGSKKKASKKYSRSLMAKNRLFTKNSLFEKKKSAKNKIFDPNSPYFQPGGEIEYDQLPDRYRYALQNFVYPNISTDPNDYEEDENGNLIPVIRSGYNPLNNTITYDPNNPIENINNDWWREHELFHQLQTLAGGQNTSDAGMLLQKPNPYVASDEAIGSYHNRRESDVNNTIDKMIAQDPSLQFIPREKLAQSTYEEGMNEPGFVGAEDLQYADPSTLEGEARQYEQYIEAGNPSIFNKKQDGGVIVELDDNEIEEYRKGGYIVEDISIPSLTKASYGHSVGNLIRKQGGGSISGTQGLTDDFSQRLTQFILDARAQGVDLGVGSGYRSYEKQKRLWEQALKKYGSPEKARKWVAPPGGSFHNKGLAVDLNSNGQFLGKDANSKATEWAHANAKKYGLHFRMGHEPWHIEPIEKTKSSSGHDHVHDDDVIVDKYGDQPKPTTQEEYNKMIELKNLEFEAKQRELEEIEKALHDDDYSKWKPAKKEVVDERQQVLDAYSQIIAPSSQNVFEQYAANLQGQMKNGGFIMELDDYQIQKYLEGGYIIEDID